MSCGSRASSAVVPRSRTARHRSVGSKVCHSSFSNQFPARQDFFGDGIHSVFHPAHGTCQGTQCAPVFQVWFAGGRHVHRTAHMGQIGRRVVFRRRCIPSDDVLQRSTAVQPHIVTQGNHHSPIPIRHVHELEEILVGLLQAETLPTVFRPSQVPRIAVSQSSTHTLSSSTASSSSATTVAAPFFVNAASAVSFRYLEVMNRQFTLFRWVLIENRSPVRAPLEFMVIFR